MICCCLPVILQQRRCGKSVIGAISHAARAIHGTSTVRSVAVPAETTTEKQYVSPHNWKKMAKDYGKPVDAGAVREVEIQTIHLNSRPETDQGSRYSRKIRERKSACRAHAFRHSSR